MIDPVDLARQLIAIDSVNPSLVAGAAGESAIAGFCAQWLADQGFEVSRLESMTGRPSVVGIRRGSGGGRSLLLTGHLDTVGVGTWQGDPFSGEIIGDRLVGRGGYDMKGGVAALLVAAASAPPGSGDVIVALVADEEFGSHGTEEVLASITADAAIVTEPSDLELTVAHRGFAWFRVDIVGKAAHGSLPHQGVDAIAHAVLILRALDVFADQLGATIPHPLLGQGTVRVSTINGGVDAATVAPAATLTIERRFLPGESPEAVEHQLRHALTGLLDATADGAAHATLTSLVARGAFEADPNWPIVELVSRHAKSVLGRHATRRGEPFWTDAGLIAAAGIPCLLIGAVGGGAHADDEWVSIESIGQLTRILTAVTAEFCA
jgi:acetylornithine deacetylase